MFLGFNVDRFDSNAAAPAANLAALAPAPVTALVALATPEATALPALATPLAAALPALVNEARAEPPDKTATIGIATIDVKAAVGPATQRMGQVTLHELYAVEGPVQGLISSAYHKLGTRRSKVSFGNKTW
ncbi:hypothetical protein ACM66B_006359 [Microbotryomycetes sp. NB124-2]